HVVDADNRCTTELCHGLALHSRGLLAACGPTGPRWSYHEYGGSHEALPPVSVSPVSLSSAPLPPAPGPPSGYQTQRSIASHSAWVSLRWQVSVHQPYSVFHPQPS